MKFYEVCWNEMWLAGCIRQFGRTKKEVKRIKEEANKRYADNHEGIDISDPDYFTITEYRFKNTSSLVFWLNKACRNNECCGDGRY